MELNSYNEYRELRENVLNKGLDNELTYESAGTGIAKLDVDNPEYFSEFVSEMHDSLKTMYTNGWINEEMYETATNNIYNYSSLVLDADARGGLQYAAMTERVNDMKSELYRRCSEGEISLDQREDMIVRLNSVLENCSDIADMEYQFGLIQEGFMDDAKIKATRIRPKSISFKYNNKVITVKCNAAGDDIKDIKDQYNGLELRINKSVYKSVATLIRKNINELGSKIDQKHAKTLSLLEKYSSASDDILFGTVKPKSVSIDGNAVALYCYQPIIPKNAYIVLKFDTNGNYKGCGNEKVGPTTESAEEIAENVFGLF